MKKILIILLTCVIMVSGCGRQQDRENGDENKNNSKETVLVTEKQDVALNSNEACLQSQYINDTLYYMTLIKNEDSGVKCREIYMLKENNEPYLKYVFDEKMLIDSFSVDNVGNIYAVVKENDQDYYLTKILNDGATEFCSMLSSIAGNYIDKESCHDAISNNYGYCMITTEDTCIMWNVDGEETATFQLNIKHTGGMVTVGFVNGNAGTYIYYENGMQIYLIPFDIKKGTIGEETVIDIPRPYMSTLTSYRLYSGHAKGIFISTQDNLYLYDDSSRDLKELLCWSDPFININRSCVYEIGIDDNNCPFLFCYDESQTETSLIRIVEKNKDELDKKVVEIGYLHDSSKYALEQYVREFNQIQNDTVIIFKKYKDSTDLHLDFVSGKGPDILDVYGLDIDEYVEKNMLENLDPYFESAETLKKEDILPTIRDIITKDGGIRFVFPSFTVKLLLMKNGYLDCNTITVQEYLKLANGSDYDYLCDFTKSSLFIQLFNFERDKYINWDNKQCDFCNEYFVSFLKDLKQAKLIEHMESAFISPDQIYQNEYLSTFLEIGSIRAYAQIKHAFGEIAQIMSYPNWRNEEIYPINTPSGVLAISTASEQKNEAWLFLEYYISMYAENTNALRGNFSILKDKFEEQLMPRLEKNQDYNLIVMYTGESIKYSYEDNDQLFGLTDEDRDLIRHIVDNLLWMDPVPSGKISDIVISECMYYLNDDKTAEEVAAIVQNRVNLYMEE